MGDDVFIRSRAFDSRKQLLFISGECVALRMRVDAQVTRYSAQEFLEPEHLLRNSGAKESSHVAQVTRDVVVGINFCRLRLDVEGPFAASMGSRRCSIWSDIMGYGPCVIGVRQTEKD